VAKKFNIAVVVEAIDKLSGPMRRAASSLRQFAFVTETTSALGRLGDRLGVPVFNAGMKEAGKHVGDLTDSVRGMWGMARTAAFALTAVAGSALLATNAYAEYTGKIHDQARATGISAKALQGWAYVAKQSGIEADKFFVAMKIGSKNIGLAAVGQGKAKDVLSGFGISIRDATGHIRSMDALLPEIADKLKRLKSPQLQAAAAAKIFVKSGADMLPMLLEGSAGIKAMTERARELGLVLSNDAIAQGDDLGDSMDDVKASLLGVRNTIFKELAPTLIMLARRFSDFVVQNRPQIEAFARVLADKLPGALDQIGASFAALHAIVSPFLSVLGFLNDLFGATNLVAALLAVTVAVNVTSAIMELIPLVKDLSVALMTTPVGWIVASLAALALAAMAIYNNWDKLVDWWGRIWETIGGTVYNAVQRIKSILPDWLLRALGGGGTVSVQTQPQQFTPAAQLGQQAARGGRQDYVRVQVDMNNMPAGTRVSTDSSGLPLDLFQGFALATP